MNDYPSLFDTEAPALPLAKRRVASTSVTAYYSTAKETLREQVRRKIEQLGECTMQDVADKLGKPINTITPRFGELVTKGLIEKTGRTKKNPGSRLPAETYRCITKADS